ncbi:unnamed protein product [Rhizoctonia solani]|uniref:RING-type E3 ubiquitin transferase n=1 Tax=Rhizoctonia solani TaxID=456999 RepID=A0A8H3C4F2_9AGAM|nr:unnamed protein product [Rhizoctonia solani]
MGQETSALNARGANGPSSRRISRYLRRESGGDGDGRPHTQEGLEAPTPGADTCAAPGDNHLDDNPHLAQGHRVVRAHHPQPQQAPATTETGQATTGHRSPTEDRVGGTAMAQSPETTPDTAAATSKYPEAPPAMAQSQASSPTHCSAQSLEQPQECLFATRSASPPATTPVTPVESLQSALASSQTPTPDSAPTLASSALPTLTQPLSSIPRPLPLGTTMIVQGLVQTIEVSRIPARTTPNEESNPETRPLLDKGKAKEEATESGPLASGSSPRSTPVSNTSASDPDTLSNDGLSTTPNTPSESNTTSRTSRTSSPSSTDVLGLLLSIAAQATAEALVPWSVPPRSRTAPREGIAGGLAAAFSALAGAGAGVTTNASPETGITVPEPLPSPQPTIQPLTPPPTHYRHPPPPPRFSRYTLSPGRLPSFSSRRISSLIPGRTSSSPTPRRASSAPEPSRRRSVLSRIERWVPRRLRRPEVRSEPETPVDESVDFGRAPPGLPFALPGSDVPESSVSPLPSPPLVGSSLGLGLGLGSSMSVPAPISSGVPVPAPSTIPTPTPPPVPPTSDIPAPTPTTNAEDLIRFSQMLGFTPGAVHPSGTFERFLADMQDELRVALGEYQERVRVRGAEGNGEGSAGEGSADVEGNTANDGDRSRLDHTRPHVPSTDPLPLNWWRMYRFPALPDGGASSGSDSSGTSTAPTLLDEAGATASAEILNRSGAEDESGTPNTNDTPNANDTPNTNGTTPNTNDTETQQPIHPAIIIGLRSITRDPTEETAESESGRARSTEAGGRVRLSESDRVRSSESGDRVRSFESGDRVRSLGGDRVRRRLRLGEEEERRTRDGTRNYIIWIIGGYYPSNHPLLAHPNLFLGQVHPDELWMLNEFLGQVKPPTVSREDIAKAGLRIVKGVEVKKLAEAGAVTENCTERCLICLDDYADDEDLRIMKCKHMFHKGCVDHWMEVGRNNCPACRTKGVETTSAPETSTPVS